MSSGKRAIHHSNDDAPNKRFAVQPSSESKPNTERSTEFSTKTSTGPNTGPSTQSRSQEPIASRDDEEPKRPSRATITPTETGAQVPIIPERFVNRTDFEIHWPEIRRAPIQCTSFGPENVPVDLIICRGAYDDKELSDRTYDDFAAGFAQDLRLLYFKKRVRYRQNPECFQTIVNWLNEVGYHFKGAFGGRREIGLSAVQATTQWSKGKMPNQLRLVLFNYTPSPGDPLLQLPREVKEVLFIYGLRGDPTYDPSKLEPIREHIRTNGVDSQVLLVENAGVDMAIEPEQTSSFVGRELGRATARWMSGQFPHWRQEEMDEEQDRAETSHTVEQPQMNEESLSDVELLSDEEPLLDEQLLSDEDSQPEIPRMDSWLIRFVTVSDEPRIEWVVHPGTQTTASEATTSNDTNASPRSSLVDTPHKAVRNDYSRES
ncbi:uncharacterized protein BDZ99DRAFT_519816 [Mytilinidion resinicola]|uniref:Uncharacterized protein n=1 Tax=Mytilinidion resinicola TaxID=574789 RepID=A0A6A6YSZ2_9PEZI|nr:uncharacterized protein BDZ99DRAFT_519816 [Mytilinidion resinicola]KAF2811154.1 hypothetical protein BDZ99DRAFT_519816 [Mytilinidion resinicola]